MNERKSAPRRRRWLALALFSFGGFALLVILSWTGLLVYEGYLRSVAAPAWIDKPLSPAALTTGTQRLLAAIASADGGTKREETDVRHDAPTTTSAEATTKMLASDDAATSPDLTAELPFIVMEGELSAEDRQMLEAYNSAIAAIGRELSGYLRDRDQMTGQRVLACIRGIAYDYFNIQPEIHDLLHISLMNQPDGFARLKYFSTNEIPRFWAFFERIRELVVREAVRQEQWFWAYDNTPVEQSEQRLYFVKRMHGLKKFECLWEWNWDNHVWGPLEQEVAPLFGQEHL